MLTLLTWGKQTIWFGWFTRKKNAIFNWKAIVLHLCIYHLPSILSFLSQAWGCCSLPHWRVPSVFLFGWLVLGFFTTIFQKSLILRPPPQHSTWIWPEKAWSGAESIIHFLTLTSVLKHLAASGSHRECSRGCERMNDDSIRLRNVGLLSLAFSTSKLHVLKQEMEQCHS